MATPYPLSPLMDIPEAQEEIPSALSVVAPAAASEPTDPALLPGAGVPTIPQPLRPDTSRVQGQFEGEIAEQKRRQKALDVSEEQRFERERAELSAAYQQEQEADAKLLADFAAGRKEYQEAVKRVPEWKPEPVVKAQDYQNFSMMLMAMGLIFGTAFKDGWMESAGLMNGAMQGYLDGDLEKAQQNWDNFQRKYQGQMDKVKAAQKEMEDVLYADNLTLNQKARDVSRISAMIGREDQHAAAQQRSIDNMMKMADASARAILTADTKYDAMVTSMQTAMAKIKASYGATDLLTDHAQHVMARLAEITAGKNDLVKAVNSRFMRQSASHQVNLMIEGIRQRTPGITDDQVATELAQNAVKYQGEMSAFRQSLQREAGVARLTIAVQTLEQKVIQAATQYGLYDQRWMNMPMNALRDKLGDADYTRFHNLVVAVARQYMEAITMPGSNAQLHASSQAAADHMISDDMTLSQLVGAFDAFNSEIGASGAALQTTVEKLLDSIGATSVKSLVSYQGGMFAGSLTEQQLEDKWNQLPKALTGQ